MLHYFVWATYCFVVVVHKRECGDLRECRKASDRGKGRDVIQKKDFFKFSFVDVISGLNEGLITDNGTNIFLDIYFCILLKQYFL